jgi:hypothetical protein
VLLVNLVLKAFKYYLPIKEYHEKSPLHSAGAFNAGLTYRGLEPGVAYHATLCRLEWVAACQ